MSKNNQKQPPRKASDLLNKAPNSTVVLEPIDGGRSRLGPPEEVKVAVPMDHDEVRPPVKVTRDPEDETAGRRTDRQFKEALSTPIDAEIEQDEATVTQRLEKIRDRIRNIKGNSTFWNNRLSYAQRQVLNGALTCAEEALSEDDDNGLPKTLARFLGLDRL